MAEGTSLAGFVDLHLHAGPALIAREFKADQVAVEAIQAKLGAIVLKDHHVPTMSLAKTLDDRFDPDGLRVFGGVVLNSSVGGLNPFAVEAAAGFGAKVVWMPTVSALNHQESLKKEGVVFPAVAGTGRTPDPPLTWVDENGRLSNPAEAILDVLARHPDMILATGHGSARETDLLVGRAFERGLDKVLVNHPLYMVGAAEEDLMRWTGLGAFLEFTAIASLPGTPMFSIPPARVAEVVNMVGPEKIVLSSDLGLKGCGPHSGGMARFLELLQEEGVGEDHLWVMTRDNPVRLLGL